VLIGDPKQSIYSFRGADIFAYLRARNDTPAAACFTMDTNYRSTSAMVHVSTGFLTVRGPLSSGVLIFTASIHGTRCRRTAAAGRRLRSPAPAGTAAAGGETLRPEQKHHCQGEGRGAAARWAALEIARLLELGRRGSARIGPDCLAGGDLAVLVRTHQEAFLVQEELRRLNIACVYYSQESVYTSDEAGSCTGSWPPWPICPTNR
jgi:exodeoxyribonuclease V beta subunit